MFLLDCVYRGSPDRNKTTFGHCIVFYFCFTLWFDRIRRQLSPWCKYFSVQTFVCWWLMTFFFWKVPTWPELGCSLLNTSTPFAHDFHVLCNLRFAIVKTFKGIQVCDDASLGCFLSAMVHFHLTAREFWISSATSTPTTLVNLSLCFLFWFADVTNYCQPHL